MGESTVIKLSLLLALQNKMDTLSHNVANANTTGFRARQLAFQEYLSPPKGGDPTEKPDRPASQVTTKLPYVAASQGAIEPTGNPLDLAIEGDAYFVVQTPQGDRYTRAGAFTLNNSGQLVTLGGQPVLAQNGILQVPPADGDLTVSSDGTVSTKRGVIGRLRLVRFAESQAIRPEGANLLQAERPLEIAPGAVRLMPGALEKSNVQITLEMARLSEITRSYEMAANLLKNSQSADDINKLSMVPEN